MVPAYTSKATFVFKPRHPPQSGVVIVRSDAYNRSRPYPIFKLLLLNRGQQALARGVPVPVGSLSPRCLRQSSLFARCSNALRYYSSSPWIRGLIIRKLLHWEGGKCRDPRSLLGKHIPSNKSERLSLRSFYQVSVRERERAESIIVLPPFDEYLPRMHRITIARDSMDR